MSVPQSDLHESMLLDQPVNVWALRKEPRIKSMLLLLIDSLGQTDWRVDLSVKCTREGIYLIHRDEPELRAYLHIHGQRPGRAGLHLEYPVVIDMPPTLETYEDLRWPQVVDMLSVFFGISEVKMVSDQGNQ